MIQDVEPRTFSFTLGWWMSEGKRCRPYLNARKRLELPLLRSANAAYVAAWADRLRLTGNIFTLYSILIVERRQFLRNR
jgi:hypothetical protein